MAEIYRGFSIEPSKSRIRQKIHAIRILSQPDLTVFVDEWGGFDEAIEEVKRRIDKYRNSNSANGV
ncbi:hypothetical protein BH10PSE7_BH10PSE7_00900 [soil metagenome]